MKLGLATQFGTHYDSVKRIAGGIAEFLTEHHHVRHLLPSSTYASPQEEGRAAEHIVRSSDALIGFHSVLYPLLAARHRLGIRLPCAVFVLGSFPRGATTIRRLLPYLTTDDILVANCTADVELARKFVPHARVDLIPFSFDDTVFYPLPDEERTAVRQALGFTQRSRVLLYAGRATVEKNLYTTLRVFAALQRVLPDAHLVLAGRIQDIPFFELGVMPLQYARSIDKAIRTLRIPTTRIRYLGSIDPGRLHALYNAADVMINMTLHHDENFGLGQVEAIACGTPVIGTAWGGLRDTVQDGVNGYQVGTVVSPLGVKVDWWGAINKTLLMLSDTKGSQFDRAAVCTTSEEYSKVQFGARLQTLLDQLVHGSSNTARPLTVSEFGREYWEVCTSENGSHAQYTPGSYSFQLYRELIGSYAGSAPECVGDDLALESDHVLSLAMPVTILDDNAVSVSDPLYPFLCRIPERYEATARAILRAMLREPAITVLRLTNVYLAGYASARDAIGWMLSVGLILRSHHRDDWIAPDIVGSYMAESPFTMQRIDRYATDFMVLE